ncbi:hypothetical protein BV898_09395 [Hypsibius exemplaris]|uniref:DOMON domain-containing protein n=1 Tax=Hypsibius exemplaris TaxID=2072580 RepID=A0A1W0WMG7_HYPEX|nr:hypothetical protein BV898_09395 [Hypsibius exemplaris]
MASAAVFVAILLLIHACDGQNCGSSGITCVGLPARCATKGAAASCEILAEVSVVGDSVHVDLSAAAKGSKLNLDLKDRWIAVGFSESGRMPKTPVVHCFEDAGKAQAKLTFNSDVGWQNFGWKNIDQSQLGVLKTSVNETGLSCSVSLKRSIAINAFTFDLAKTKHKLLIATGPMRDGAITFHRTISPETSFPDSYLF